MYVLDKMSTYAAMLQNITKASNHHWNLVQSESPVMTGLEFLDYSATHCISVVSHGKNLNMQAKP